MKTATSERSHQRREEEREEERQRQRNQHLLRQVERRGGHEEGQGVPDALPPLVLRW